MAIDDRPTSSSSVTKKLVLGLLVTVLAISLLAHAFITLQPRHMDEGTVLANVRHFAMNRTIIPQRTLYPPLYDYMITPFVGAASLTAILQGRPPSMSDFRHDMIHELTPEWSARVVTFIFFAIAVWLTYLTTRKLTTGSIAPLLGMTALAAAYGPLRHSGYALSDVPVMAFAIAILFVAVGLPSSEHPYRTSAACGGLLGFAMATKYTALGMALPIVVAVYLTDPSMQTRLRLLGVAVSASIIAFLIGAPGWIIAFGQYWESLLFEIRHMSSGHSGFHGVPFLGQMELLFDHDPHILLLTFILLIVVLLRWRPESAPFAVVLAGLVGTLALAAPAKKQSIQYILAVYPAMAITIAVGVDRLPRRHTNYAAGVVALALVVSSLVSLNTALHAALLPESKDVARHWITTHIDAHRSIALDWEYVPTLYTSEEIETIQEETKSGFMHDLFSPLAKPYSVVRLVYDIERERTSLQHPDLEYIVTSSGCYDRYFDHGVFTRRPPPPGTRGAESFVRVGQFYAALFDGQGGWEPVYSVDTGNGPAVTIFGRQHLHDDEGPG